MLLNVVVERLTVLLPVREVPGSNFRAETGYPDRFFVGFPSPSMYILGQNLN
jgi:hypothetical protein